LRGDWGLGFKSMTDKNGNFDDEPKLGIPAGLHEDLRGLFNSGLSVPAEVDRAIIDVAHRLLIRSGRRHPWPRWAAVAAAAAAVIIFAVVLETRFSRVSDTNSTSDKSAWAPEAAKSGLAGDIDGNGRVNILDAFKLARRIESAGATEGKWDINGDGLVNRDDVDFVAFAAVRLNKGV